MARLKGICYGNDAFPKPYEEATANNTQVFFGSDSAAEYIAPLWTGAGYKSSTGSQCESGSVSAGVHCRNDLGRMKNMGVELIRLYDWDPRNRHLPFLKEWGRGVLAPVSNYNLKAGYNNRLQNIPNLIKSFSNEQQTDYHQAIEGIIIGNEPRVSGFSVAECIQFTKDWVSIEKAQFGSYRKLPIGHPVDFNQYGGKYPCWGFWDPLVEALKADLPQRLFLAPQTYNDAVYLFENAEGSKRGWVDLTYDKYRMPIWFTEIGADRITRSDHLKIVEGQLLGCIKYSRQNPQKLFGACFFSFTDKVWMQGTSEGSFGAYTHQRQGACTITYSDKDFTHRDYTPPPNSKIIPIGTLNVDVLLETKLHEVVNNCYSRP